MQICKVDLAWLSEPLCMSIIEMNTTKYSDTLTDKMRMGWWFCFFANPLVAFWHHDEHHTIDHGKKLTQKVVSYNTHTHTHTKPKGGEET